MSTFVFLGPSLPLAAARERIDAVFLPPVAMGDLYTLVETRAKPGDRIAIIDGFFEARPAVWHKEVLHALDRGIAVFGASSMGALRAAETWQFGTIGVGRIFDAFRDGTLTDDDEVAVAHADAEAGFRSLSAAMASLRFGLADLVADGLIEQRLADDLVRRLKAVPYAQRSWALAVEQARLQGADDAAIEAIRNKSRQPDTKEQDAMALLDLLAAQTGGAAAPHAAEFTFQTTTFWTGLTASMAMRVEQLRSHSGAAESLADVADLAAFVRAGAEGREALLDRALLDRLTAEWSASYAPDAADRKAAMARLARRNGLATGEALTGWRHVQGLSAHTAWLEVVDREARRHWLRAQFAADLDRFVVARVKAEGLYDKLERARGVARGRIDTFAVAKPSLQDFGLTPADLQHWYQQRFGPMYPDPTTHAQELGFPTLGAFVERVLECFLADDAAPEPVVRSTATMENQL